MTVALWWIRRDLRLRDNPALEAALKHADQVVPVFILDSRLVESRYAGSKRLAFLYNGLRSLDTDLRQRGSRLLVKRGEPVSELGTLLKRFKADRVFASPDYSTYARRRDAKAAERLPLQMVGNASIQPPGAISKTDGEPYRVFTPFSRVWKDLLPPLRTDLTNPPDHIPSPANLESGEIPELSKPADATAFKSGEAEALRRLGSFTKGSDPPVYRYAIQRDDIGLEATSQLSPYLRFGMLSGRRAAAAALQAAEDAPVEDSRQGADVWLNELIWRDFYLYILFHFPEVLTGSFRDEFAGIAWINDASDFEAWRLGQTGYPIVDASMRQLSRTGWMHNRGRMIVACFLVKDLLVDWRWGERWFMRHLVDGDPASNNGGWQWVAGTGTDAAPYFRIFNPTSQAKKYDPDGSFVRRWLPELSRVPTKYVHEPWLMPGDVQRESGCLIGQDFPEPIIDHAYARKRTLSIYRQARESEGR